MQIQHIVKNPELYVCVRECERDSIESRGQCLSKQFNRANRQDKKVTRKVRGDRCESRTLRREQSSKTCLSTSFLRTSTRRPPFKNANFKKIQTPITDGG
ncbi:hypothetical protein X975_07288, partial [Stegodyphus mimosarum]